MPTVQCGRRRSTQHAEDGHPDDRALAAAVTTLRVLSFMDARQDADGEATLYAGVPYAVFSGMLVVEKWRGFV